MRKAGNSFAQTPVTINAPAPPNTAAPTGPSNRATTPLIAGLMVAIRLNDGGPTIIAVPRVGRNGRTFGMWKLRSMRAETPDGMAKGVALTTEHDDRITPIGRRMRAWHLDELPQLFNVVRGEMCLLGARPEAPEFVDATDPRWRHVLSAPPCPRRAFRCGCARPGQAIGCGWVAVIAS